MLLAQKPMASQLTTGAAKDVALKGKELAAQEDEWEQRINGGAMMMFDFFIRPVEEDLPGRPSSALTAQKLVAG